MADGAVLGDALRLESRHGFVARNSGEEAGFLAFQSDRDDERDVPADRLLRRPPVQPLGAAVPARDDAFEVLGEDRVLRRLDDGDEFGRSLADWSHLGRCATHDAEPLSPSANYTIYDRVNLETINYHVG